MISLALDALAIFVSAAAIAWAAWEAGRNYEVQRAAKRAAKEVMPDEAVRPAAGQPELHAMTGGAHPTNAPCNKHVVRGVRMGQIVIHQVGVAQPCIYCGQMVNPMKAEVVVSGSGVLSLGDDGGGAGTWKVRPE